MSTMTSGTKTNLASISSSSHPELNLSLSSLMSIDNNSDENDDLLSKVDAASSAEVSLSPDTPSFMLNIESSPMYDLKQLRIITECSTIEVYLGQHGEYSDTSTPVNMLDDQEELYDHIIMLKKLQCNVRLKFVTKCSKFFILALNLMLKKRDECGSKGNFDLDQVSQLVSDEQLSERAKGFKRLFESFQASNSSNSPMMNQGPPQLMLMLETRLRLEVRAVESRMDARLEQMREMYELRLNKLEKEIETLKRADNQDEKRHDEQSTSGDSSTVD